MITITRGGQRSLQPAAVALRGVVIALIAFLAAETWLFDGGLAGVARRVGGLLAGLASVVSRAAR